MSGTYSAGSNSFVAGKVAATSPYLPTGLVNKGAGVISNLAQTTPFATGVLIVRITAGGNPASFQVIYNPFSGMPVMSSIGTVSSATPTNFSESDIPVTFTISNMTGTGSYGTNDGFTLYIADMGQNISPSVPLQHTGLSVTVQQFQTGGEPLYWGNAINAMFMYCGLNPGVIGIIPPGFYCCDDAPSSGKLFVQSNMTISAYGAVIFTSKDAGTTHMTPGELGFLTVSNAATASAPGTGLHNITIMGGTWGSAGLNGALCTDNSLLYLSGPTTGSVTRSGNVVSLFVDHDLTLIDVTVRGWSNGLAFYLFCNSNLTTRNCSFWNSDGMAGSGGMRIANGSNISATNTNGISGDDCLQFAVPGSGTQGATTPFGIFNAFFIGGTVTSLNARAMVVTCIVGGTGSSTTPLMSLIQHVGFIGIAGNIGANSGAACFISNQNSVTASVTLPQQSMPMPVPPPVVPPSIQDVTVAGCKLIAPATATNQAMIAIQGGGPFTVTNADMSTTTYYCGPVQDIYFSDTSTTNAATVAVSIAGYYSTTSPGSSTYITAQNVNFRTCAFYQPLGSTTAGTVTVFNCVGYSFDTCVVYSNSSSTAASSCFVLGARATAMAPGKIASLGRISGCTLYTNSTSTASQPPLIVIYNGDMNAVTGWSRFFLGTEPVIGGAAGSATSVITLWPNVSGTYTSSVTNTLIDDVDMRGVPTTTPINDAGVNTRAGLNILATPATGALTLSKVRYNVPSTPAYSWPQFATILEMTSTTAVSGATINLPPVFNDGQVLILAAPFASYTNITFSPPVQGITSGMGSVGPGPNGSLRIAWDASAGKWFPI